MDPDIFYVMQLTFIMFEDHFSGFLMEFLPEVFRRTFSKNTGYMDHLTYLSI